MTIETATFLTDLNAANPGVNDAKSEGDDHLRLIKQVLKNTFPSQTTAVITEAINSSNTKIATTAFANPASSLGGGGGSYVKLPSGLIIQVAQVTSSTGGDVSWSLPLAFPSAVLGAWGNYTNGGGSGAVFVSTGAQTLSLINFGAYSSATGARVSGSCFMFALGF